jgi:AcrR family transcriptional regulator
MKPIGTILGTSGGTMKSEAVSPRVRIIEAATDLFYGQGINATGVAEVAERAGVSKRTLYHLFPSKDILVAEYLKAADADIETNEHSLLRTDLTAREQLLALFDRPQLAVHFRGCPFHNAAVELSDANHPGNPLVVEHKHAFLRQIIDTARRAGARDPDLLGRQLAVIFEGAMALSASLNSLEGFDFARTAAKALISQALPVEQD